MTLLKFESDKSSAGRRVLRSWGNSEDPTHPLPHEGSALGV